MVISALSAFVGTTIAFVVFAMLTSYEQRRGKRLILGGVRGWLDRQLGKLGRAVDHGFDYIARRIIKFTWYYSISSFFRGLLKLLESLYLYLEQKMRWHHRQATQARAETPRSGNLGALAEHKEAVALTDKQKQKRKADSLEG
ncbi:MAG: hypothetical protein AAGA35_02335 [Patescibacteria group bacterium]